MTTALARTAPASRPHLTPVPDCEPPFDDEVVTDRARQRRIATSRVRVLRAPQLLPSPRRSSSEPGGGPGTVTLPSAPQRSDRTPEPEALLERGSATVTRAAATAVAPLVLAPVPDQSYAGDVGVRRTPSSELPPASRVAVALGRALVEALTGVRSTGQLQPHCTPPVYAGLVARTPLPGRGVARVQSVHTSTPADGVAEVSMVVRRDDRCRAIAFRLTGLDGRWRITALQIG